MITETNFAELSKNKQKYGVLDIIDRFGPTGRPQYLLIHRKVEELTVIKDVLHLN